MRFTILLLIAVAATSFILQAAGFGWWLWIPGVVAILVLLLFFVLSFKDFGLFHKHIADKHNA